MPTMNNSERNTMTTLPVAPRLTSLFEDTWEELGEENGSGHDGLRRNKGSSPTPAVVASSSQESVRVVRHGNQSASAIGTGQHQQGSIVRTERRMRGRVVAGQLLAESLRRSGMSQRAFADRLGISESRVRKMIAGEVAVDIGALVEAGRVGLEVIRRAMQIAEGKAVRA